MLKEVIVVGRWVRDVDLRSIRKCFCVVTFQNKRSGLRCREVQGEYRR